MKIQIITLFPDMFAGVLGSSMLWKAQDKGIVEYQTVDLRQFGLGQRRTVDDTPYGGGDGMLLRVDTLVAEIEFAGQPNKSKNHATGVGHINQTIPTTSHSSVLNKQWQAV
jgi:tRNA (guanine37-N1)-methyltransferase